MFQMLRVAANRSLISHIPNLSDQGCLNGAGTETFRAPQAR